MTRIRHSLRQGLFRWACVLAGLALPALAQAASITIRIEYSGTPSPGNYAYDVIADLEPGARLGGLNLVAVGFTSLSPNTANPAISLADSGFVAGPFGDARAAFGIINTGNGVALAEGPAASVILGTLFSPYWTMGDPMTPPIPLAVFDDSAYFGGAVFDDFLEVVPDAVVIQVANNGYEPPPEWVHPGVAEPARAALVALAGAGLLALVAARELSGRRLRE